MANVLLSEAEKTFILQGVEVGWPRLGCCSLLYPLTYFNRDVIGLKPISNSFRPNLCILQKATVRTMFKLEF